MDDFKKNVLDALVSYRGFDPKWSMGQYFKIDLKSKFDPKLVA